MAKIELDREGKTFAQLYAAMTLDSFGRNLQQNVLWLGAISYTDTMENTVFLSKHPEFSPAATPELASAHFAARTWLHHDFNAQTPLQSVFAYGRGDFGYISTEREWEHATTFFAKVISAHQTFMQLLQ